MSFIVHPYLFSSNSFQGGSSTSAGNTIVSGLSAVFVDCIFSGSIARTRTIGALNVMFDLICLGLSADFGVDLLTVT